MGRFNVNLACAPAVAARAHPTGCLPGKTQSCKRKGEPAYPREIIV
jgi:hypothetical protein